MPKPLLVDGADVGRCPHRVALERGGPERYVAEPASATLLRLQRKSTEQRHRMRELWLQHQPDTTWAQSVEDTVSALANGAHFVLEPRLPDDLENRRRSQVDALVRVDDQYGRTSYAPVLFRNIEVGQSAATKRSLQGSVKAVAISRATWVDGVGSRRNDTVRRTMLNLAHAWRTLHALGYAHGAAYVGVLDRKAVLWWYDLAAESAEWGLNEYDRQLAECHDVLDRQERWVREGGDYPTAPYWHSECERCPFSQSCRSELETRDDVSLTQWTRFAQQLALREHGVTTRAELARLDARAAQNAERTILTSTSGLDPVVSLAKQITRFDELIYRARSSVAGSFLLRVPADQIGCRSADVEIDIDMESYDDVPYLWGAVVSVAEHVQGIESEERSFVTWEPLTQNEERTLFIDFWTWLQDVRRRAHAAGYTVAIYCYYQLAEVSALRRGALATDSPEQFAAEIRSVVESAEWVDLHDVAKSQLQTPGPQGLKVMAVAAGFRWRDPEPNGEASMVWYEDAVNALSPTSGASRQRILEYNIDDCRATRALRRWINTDAPTLPSRDVVPGA